ncbi:presenilins-associated rhomboid-like protein, mitochondrial [Eurytemora carolleeae]|uniref:presenilins-associated rhomboid-like protein, mitochondrial n=1 Tax=Eurytemora carolleeae TaxID=1294199 RepID=UPI000C76921C|nr:presenilins-associated rhomboid-like protein, mitochondrial [Eurytemora carolleeae]|eukprot:XP_023320132.1 presenilins-associated rhomboid-like protein, mitochondrial [Eurytemora affinis]
MSVLGRLCLKLAKPIQIKPCDLLQTRCFRTKRKPGEKDLGSQPVIEDGNLPAVGFKALGRPVVFSAVFCGGTLAGCAIWQYENMREAAKRSRILGWRNELLGRKAGSLREEFRQWWKSLPHADKLFIPICALNCLVFAAWRIPNLQVTMLKWFASNPAGKATCLPMLLSAFSHYSIFHLGFNMFVLHSFMGPAVKLLGQEQFMAVYLSSGVLTSLASYVHKIGIGRMGYSLGASGAIYTVLGIFGTLVPDAQLHMILLPMFTFSASTAIKGLMCMDAVGLVMGWRVLDHSAHLAGILYGIFWVHMGSRLLWDSREPVVQAWHSIRSQR